MKRKHDRTAQDQENEITPTPKRSRKSVLAADTTEETNSATGSPTADTPSKKSTGRSTRGKAIQSGLEALGEPDDESITPKAKAKGKGKVLFDTPTKPRKALSETQDTITVGADRSARRKSARNLIERTVAGDLSDDNGIEEEDTLAQQIYEDGEAEEEEEEDGDAEEAPAPDTEATPTATPSKRRPGRPKGARNRSITPPTDLPPHETYFFQNRPGKIKTSSNTLSSLSLLTHSTYHSLISSHEDPHTTSISFLHALHTRAFPQWAFELSQSFSLCLYGYGSKRALVAAFAKYIHSAQPPSAPPTTIIINGTHPACTPSAILTTTFSTLPCPPSNLPTQPSALLPLLLAHLTQHPPPKPIYILLSSIDAPPLRRPPTQSLLATLAAHPSIYFLATADHPSFPLLWDPALRAQFNFLFHDATTFVSYDDGKGTGEVGGVVDTVHELMGRRGVGRRGREGVGWVLRSLPENARGVFRILCGEILAGDGVDGEGEGGEGDGDSDEDDELGADGFDDTPRAYKKQKRRRGAGETEEALFGVEYKTLYQKAVEEFLCSSEMAFRTLLKEFVDHQVIVTRRDGAGGEVLGVPMRREEVEGVLEDLVG
ncbi:Origin recognition complex subunit 2 [Trapelia coarctata]|nr:Origin recognition complex subunit 2 [Trapelia coarctata]